MLAPPVPGARICSYQYETRAEGVEHQGIDLCADCGTPIYSPSPGIVRAVYDTVLGGHTLVIQHRANLFTRYAHCERIVVSPGMSVRAGSGIATVGRTGQRRSGGRLGCHLHFAVTNKIVEPGRIYHSSDHYDALTALEGMGIVLDGVHLVYASSDQTPGIASILILGLSVGSAAYLATKL